MHTHLLYAFALMKCVPLACHHGNPVLFPLVLFTLCAGERKSEITVSWHESGWTSKDNVMYNTSLKFNEQWPKV